MIDGTLLYIIVFNLNAAINYSLLIYDRSIYVRYDLVAHRRNYAYTLNGD